MCAPRSGLELTLSGQCYFALVPAMCQPLYPFGRAGIMYTTNDISTLLILLALHVPNQFHFTFYWIARARQNVVLNSYKDIDGVNPGKLKSPPYDVWS